MTHPAETFDRDALSKDTALSAAQDHLPAAPPGNQHTIDLILTHRRDDAHQDHQLVCRLTWNTFRDHQILEYEIPKWDGDIGQPNVYVPVSAAALARKIELLMAHFGSQRSKQWFDRETCLGLARLRGMECRAPERYAEAFFARKLSLA